MWSPELASLGVKALGKIAESMGVDVEALAAQFFNMSEAEGAAYNPEGALTLAQSAASGATESASAGASGTTNAGAAYESAGSAGGADVCDVRYRPVEVVVEPGCNGFIGAAREWGEKAVVEAREAGLSDAEIRDIFPAGSVPDRLVEAELDGTGTKVATKIAMEQGLFAPGAEKDSFNMYANSKLEFTSEGELRIVDPNGKTAYTVSDCAGDKPPYDGNRMIATGPCGEDVPCPPAATVKEMAVETPVEPEPHPPAAVEVEPTPELEPVMDRVRIFNTPTIVCGSEGTCVVAVTPFLVFDSYADAQEFIDSEAGKSVLRGLTDSTGAKMGNCFYIADGEGNLQQVNLKTVDRRVGGIIIKELVLTDDGVPQLDGKPHDSTFTDDGTRRSYRLAESDFEERYARGLGDPSDMSRSRLADVKESSTFGVGAAQNLAYDAEHDRYTLEYSDASINRTEDAIVDASGLSADEYEALKSMPLPSEFYDSDASFNEKWKALREAAREQGVDMSKQGAKNMTRIIMELGFGQDANMAATNEALVSHSDIVLSSDTARPIANRVTLENAVERSAINREIILTRFITG